jgi:hypothetical protein
MGDITRGFVKKLFLCTIFKLYVRNLLRAHNMVFSYQSLTRPGLIVKILVTGLFLHLEINSKSIIIQVQNSTGHNPPHIAARGGVSMTDQSQKCGTAREQRRMKLDRSNSSFKLLSCVRGSRGDRAGQSATSASANSKHHLFL